ncbi:MAG TPA: FHA domain-containing protein [Gaiellaceae bacterium]|nr:FHA domain-containing protein [Gaiellaceae bacterium]
MEARSPAGERTQSAHIVVRNPDGEVIEALALPQRPLRVGRLPHANDIALQPDPELLVGRTAHCTFEPDGSRWYVVDGGSVNGTFLRRGDGLTPVSGRVALRDGDVVCILGSIGASGERRFFELAFQSRRDPDATRPAPIVSRGVPTETGDEGCLVYDVREARLTLVRRGERHDIAIRAQAHRLIRYMAERNAESDGSPVLCTYQELVHAVWLDEPLHTREELTKLVWELRRKLDRFGASRLIETERGLGYRLRTCSPGAAEDSAT